MRLTTRSRYGTRMLIDLALHCNSGPVNIGDIATRQKISKKYLEKLISELRKAGYITSKRGPHGGHSLAVAPEEITIGDVVRALEESCALTECAECVSPVCGVCSQAGECVTQTIWIEASRVMFEKLDSYRLSDLINNSRTIVIESKRARRSTEISPEPVTSESPAEIE